MPDERLWELSRKLYIAKPWKKLDMLDIFAIPLSQGRTGFVSVVGKKKADTKGLSLYIGQEGINSFRTALFDRYPDFGDHVLQRKALSLTFVSKDILPKEKYDEIQRYASASKVMFAKNGLPSFLRCTPYSFGRDDLTDQDWDDLLTTLEYTLEIANQLKNATPKQLGFVPFDREAEDAVVPEISLANGLYQIRQIPVPKMVEPHYEPVMAKNEIAIKKLSKFKKKGKLLCQLGAVLDPDLANDQNYFPTVIFAAEDNEDGDKIIDEMAYDYQKRPENLLDQFLQGLVEEKYIPEKFIARNEKTAAFLQDAAGKLGCSLEIREDLPYLDHVIEYYDDGDGELGEESVIDELKEMVHLVLALPEQDFYSLPGDIKSQLRGILDTGLLPDNLAEELSDRLEKAAENRSGRKRKKKPKHKKKGQREKSNRSYVISVSVYKGCYRHIRVATDVFLSDLAQDILNAFDFDDDHLYSFFMDNSAWSRENEYARERNDWSDAELASDYTLEEALCRDDGRFLFIFDYGDEWRFSCRILKEIPEPTEGCVIVRRKGDSPKQYGDEEEDFWDGFEDD